MTCRTTALRLTLLLGIALGACRHHADPAPRPRSAIVWPRDNHCWWTAVRTTLPVDTVGRRFLQAFTALGLTPLAGERTGDTVLVRGGPTALGGAHRGGMYASRMVAYQRGDSTHFRWYWFIAPLTDRGTATGDSASITGHGIGFCGEIGKLVSIHGWGPREPTSDDSIAVWSRVP